MDQAEAQHLKRTVEREVRSGFGADAVTRVALLQHGEDPAVGPDELLVRVFIWADPDAGPQPALEAWAQAHGAGMRLLRRELSLRLPAARLLEFTVENAGSTTAPAGDAGSTTAPAGTPDQGPRPRRMPADQEPRPRSRCLTIRRCWTSQ